MHIVTGGAYNGKSAWVRKFYQLDNVSNWHWIAAYDETCPKDLAAFGQDLIVLNGVEHWVYKWSETQSISEIRDFGRAIISNWVNWEDEKACRKLVVIGSDISKGIVPMEQQMRAWRDATGWFYQDLVEKCDRLDMIWYGVQTQLK
ncbi:bifunctional adenosylcobinamide kinase/adenosylcobinamide-phosphate guanylyltransferase [Lentibacillus sp. Marseille-P4043]|uniref:bifunctional adenosylcobinamide kinase/adenosylcobinamide-phosphate guanylyltransferase n=1 Tax=Lentibacillus sp. Marseille-P4043 TaxID=2040293 RepID=UPI000D0AD031|nr:bifunctional adenosylcobinamide kinase/adenosylcobinamide-phosphate guanylyltransferase [Lentibacillus sp. Marseille-P4043]